MQLSPRYGDDPILRVETTPPGDLALPLMRQRHRIVEMLRAFDTVQWAARTRCDAWSVQDVVSHLVSTNQFWAASIRAGLEGSPTRLLSEFDPVATPMKMVESVRTWSPAQTLDLFVETNDKLAHAIDGIDGDAWATKLGEAPPGHVALRAVALHALWDCWVHERDIALPLGLPVVEEPDEVVDCLHYAAALGPAFLASTGSTRRGALRVLATDPDVDIVVEVGPSVVVRDGFEASDAHMSAVVRGRAVALVEGLSFRGSFPEVGADDQWMMGGLADVFEVATP
jgi:uncharacterized protein (TIGR03083 family)